MGFRFRVFVGGSFFVFWIIRWFGNVDSLSFFSFFLGL